MAPTTISIARVLQLRVPVAWQEAVEVARAADAVAERHSRRITLEGCVISTAGTVEVGTQGADRLGDPLSGLQLLAILLEGQQAPAELRALAATANDALSSFPSEKQTAKQALTLDWFVRPNPEIEIARLARRALEAAAPAAEPSPDTRPLASRPSAMPQRWPAEREPKPLVAEAANAAQVGADHAEPSRAAVERRVEVAKPAVAERQPEPPESGLGRATEAGRCRASR